MKSIIKPLIKECLHEIMVEEGLIRMVKEHLVVETKQKQAVLPESKPVVKQLQKESVQAKQQYVETIKKKVAIGGFDPFAGTEDLDTVEAKAQEGVNVDKLFDESMINSWNQQLELLEGKRK